MRKALFIPFFFLSLLFGKGSNSLFAQSDLAFRHIPLSKGLSNKAIPAIIQDKKGYLWFATQDGLNRYDGYSFKVYQNDPANKNSLSNNNIFCLYADSEGIMWIGTEGGGLNRFDPGNETFTQYLSRPGDPNSISSNNVYCIREAPNGELWLGTWDGGISIFNKKTQTFRRIQHNPNDPSSLAKAGIWDIFFDSRNFAWISLWGEGADRLDQQTGKFTHFTCNPSDSTTISSSICGVFHEDKEGYIWMTTWGGGLDRFDPKTEKFKRYLPDAKNPGAIGGLKAWPIVEDEDGNLWIGIYGSGLNKFDRKTGKFTVYSHNENDPNSISKNDIWSLFIDRSGILWIGSEGGGIDYCTMRTKQFNFITKTNDPAVSLGEKSIRDVYEDDRGNTWFATWTEGVDKYDPGTKKITHYKNGNINGETGLNKIRCILPGDNGTLWLGTYRGGLAQLDTAKKTFTYFDPSNGDSSRTGTKYVIAVYKDAQKRFWVATLTNLSLFDEQSHRFTQVCDFAADTTGGLNTVNRIFESKNGTVWFGTNLGLFTYANGKFTKFNTKNGVELKTTIYDISEDGNGILWMATRSGLVKLDVTSGEVKTFTVKDGLPSDILFALLDDTKGNLWISTNKGLSKFIFAQNNFINYTVSDGLNNIIFYPSSSLRAKDGTLYFGGTEGVTWFNPQQIEDNAFIPPVLITSFSRFDQPVNFGMPLDEVKTISLSYDENVFSFDFVALNFDCPEKNQYAYKLEGFDKDWRYCGTSTKADYSGLPPGNYFFKVIASNNDGKWNRKGAEVEVIIHPPFWETWWFRTMCVAFLLAGGYTLYRVRVRTIHRRNIILEKTVKERTQEVVHQKEQIEQQKKELLDSIHYAKRIQTAILTSDHYWDGISPEHFIFFRPKDIVSGDFYWAYCTPHNKAIWVVADCTGHGVPGGFMSMLGNAFLNEIVVENKMESASAILDALRNKIIKALDQKIDGQRQQDGMDLSLCIWDKQTGVLEFAGANNGLYIIRGNELTELKPDKMPIGYHAQMNPFSSTTFQLQKGDLVYSFSDGYADQFGGDKGKKYKYSRLKEFLMGMHNESIEKQKELLAAEFDKWKGAHEQLDDVCVVGVKIGEAGN